MHSSSAKTRDLLHWFLDSTEIAIKKRNNGGGGIRLIERPSGEYFCNSLPSGSKGSNRAGPGQGPKQMVAGREVTSPHPVGNTDNWSEKASACLGSSEGQEGTYPRRGGTLHFGHKCNGPRARGFGSVSKLRSHKCI